jgi:hypothetical protein
VNGGWRLVSPRARSVGEGEQKNCTRAASGHTRLLGPIPEFGLIDDRVAGSISGVAAHRRLAGRSDRSKVDHGSQREDKAILTVQSRDLMADNL